MIVSHHSIMKLFSMKDKIIFILEDVQLANSDTRNNQSLVEQ